MPPPMSPAARLLGASYGFAAAVIACVLFAACDGRPTFVPGDECELNTQCGAPLVCRLGRCRVECRAQRDCGPGLECVRDERGLGACQLPSETECMLTSDCPAHLVCHFGRCTNECETDRDCPPGSACTESEDGSRGCRDESTTQCQHNSDCDAMGMSGYICAVDGRCRVPCIDDWDCSDNRQCIRPAGALPYCDFAQNDGGIDAGAMDGGVDASTAMDATMSVDAGTDAMTSSDAGMTGVAPPPPPRMAAGELNTCAAPGAEPLRCWGANADGQIGDTTITPRNAPTLVGGVGTVTVIGVGQGHACAASGSTLRCWGRNDYGQLGLGTMGATDVSSPTVVTGLPAATIDDLSLGASHTCAIASASLYCWGWNADGQLGAGDTMGRSSPTLVTLGAGEVPVEVDAFSVHTCVRLASGAVTCFGDNAYHQIGNGGTADALVPTTVPGITDAIDVATGSAHTCVLHADGDVSCWGADVLGQVGNGGTFGGLDVPSPTPTAAIGAPALEIAAGSAHTCARTASAVHCWGYNGDGQCGRDRMVEDGIFSPAPVSGVGVVQEIAAGSNHTCVHVAGRTLLCFGNNSDGQLGNGVTGGFYSTPVGVAWP